MKKLFLFFAFVFVSSVSWAQTEGTKKITYLSSNHDKVNENQDPQILILESKSVKITSESKLKGEAKYPLEEFFIDWTPATPEYIKVGRFSDEEALLTKDTSFVGRFDYEITDEEKEILGFKVRKAVTSVNSNTIELWFTEELPYKASPVSIGLELGVVLEYIRNGSSRITAVEIADSDEKVEIPHIEEVDALTYQDAVWKSRFIQVPVFEKEAVNFSADSSSNSEVLRFANGTFIVKKVKIPELKKGMQGFIQAIQRSKGDAYDRTASVIAILPDQKKTFWDALENGVETLPAYTNGNGQEYFGMVSDENFQSSIELMRFFTSFGVSHFNDRLQLKGKTWQDSSVFRQDISEFVDELSGEEVYIGAFIGNYDKNGHELSLELTFHPGWDAKSPQTQIKPLFNTTSVLEMGGQGYPTLFDTEKGLKVRFTLEEDIENVQLRYISTGHGGWGGGDEFNQKVNTIYLNGEAIHRFIPWRTDCGSFRLYNPVSGNFVNGLSSSDLSRSNWCPSSVTSPEYIELGNLKAGEYVMEVNIPQGKPEGDSFSYWNVSGALIYQNAQ